MMTVFRMYLLFAAWVAASLVIAGPAGATPTGGEDEKARAAAELRKLVRERSMNTIPREKAVLELCRLKAARELEPFLAVQRLDRTVIWALSEIGDPKSVGPVLETVDRMRLESRPYLATYVASFGTPEVRTWLAKLATHKEVIYPQQKRWIRGARLRAGDPAIRREVLAGLKSSDPDVCAAALSTLGDSRSPEFLAQVARFASDERRLTEPVKSRFRAKQIRKMPDGSTSQTIVSPELATVAAVALEAASCVVRPMTPERIAWWYGLEAGPRFHAECDGAKRLRAFVASDRKAARKKTIRGLDALGKLFDHIRASERGEAARKSKLKNIDCSFSTQWRITYELAGVSYEATVGRKGEVAVKAA